MGFRNQPSPTPDWFDRSQAVGPLVMDRVSCAVSESQLPQRVSVYPQLAFWFLCDSLSIASQANQEGMHANAVSITRSCVEAITIIELGLVGSPEAERLLWQWSRDEKTPGQLRSWLESNVWKNYGAGLWDEPWPVFYGNFARALHPFAHYSGLLAQWQTRIHQFHRTESGGGQALMEIGPRNYDPQKATRITLFHALIGFVLGRILIANVHKDDPEFASHIGPFTFCVS